MFAASSHNVLSMFEVVTRLFGSVQASESRWRRCCHSRAMFVAMSKLRASAPPWIVTRCIPITPAAPIAKSVIALRTSTTV